MEQAASDAIAKALRARISLLEGELANARSSAEHAREQIADYNISLAGDEAIIARNEAEIAILYAELRRVERA
jgi:hypothetical protein